jgi:hypothetical protein
MSFRLDGAAIFFALQLLQDVVQALGSSHNSAQQYEKFFIKPNQPRDLGPELEECLEEDDRERREYIYRFELKECPEELNLEQCLEELEHIFDFYASFGALHCCYGESFVIFCFKVSSWNLERGNGQNVQLCRGIYGPHWWYYWDSAGCFIPQLALEISSCFSKALRRKNSHYLYQVSAIYVEGICCISD